MRTRTIGSALAAAAVLAAALSALPTTLAQASPAVAGRSSGPPGATQTYLVLAADAAQVGQAARSATAAGGTVLSQDAAIGTVVVEAPVEGYVAAVQGRPGVAGVARNKAIGTNPGVTPQPDLVEQEPAVSGRSRRVPSTKAKPVAPRRPARPGGTASGTDTFEALQWDMQMIGADVARTVNPGSPKVLVGIMDTGVDASQPDLAPNFDKARSRNFTTDIPDIDGPCEVATCIDPANTDDGGHGTHVAGTVGAAANGMGIVGVAPKTTLVNVRAGQDSGYFFLAPTLEALTYSGDIGIDVVNMSFYVDPWLFNCRSNPADSAEAQYEQRTIISATNRALDYAHARGVLLVSAMGNEATDLGKPGVDASSPDYPEGAAYERTISNSDCLSMPGEGNHVYNVTAIGPSGRKADYSNYGLEQGWVSAPGGWYRDGVGTDTYKTDANLILSTYPLKVLQEEGSVDEDGNILEEAATYVFKDCTRGGACGYYTYLQGTSMAAPHAAGVAALAVSRYGTKDTRRGGLTLQPDATANYVARAATTRPCPIPPLVSYAAEERDESYDALCEGSRRFNGFYGYGIVDAAKTVGARR